MQYVYSINSSFTIDLPMLRDILETCNLKSNYSLPGRNLGYDRRTIKSYYMAILDRQPWTHYCPLYIS